MDICVCMAESLCCSPETIIALLIGHSPIRNALVLKNIYVQIKLKTEKEYWSRLPFPPPGDLPDPGTEDASVASSALAADSLPLSHLGSPCLLRNPIKSPPLSDRQQALRETRNL